MRGSRDAASAMFFTSELLTALQERRRAFDAALADQRIQGALIAVTPGRMPHFGTCPCCGYPTISPNLYDVCTICGWVDDGHDDGTAAQIDAGPNGDYSLAQARRNFIERQTMYRGSDRRQEQDTSVVEARERLIEAYDSLLPLNEPWAFIGALPRITALKTRLDETRFGEQKVRTRHADETHASRQADREWEIWRCIADAARSRTAPTTADPREYRAFQKLVSEVTQNLELSLGPAAPTVAHRGLWYRCWSSGARSAWVRPFGRSLGVEFEPSDDARPAALFPQDDDASERIATCIAAFFGDRS